MPGDFVDFTFPPEQVTLEGTYDPGGPLEGPVSKCRNPVRQAVAVRMRSPGGVYTPPGALALASDQLAGDCCPGSKSVATRRGLLGDDDCPDTGDGLDGLLHKRVIGALDRIVGDRCFPVGDLDRPTIRIA
jgi:hypothetical protein